MANAEFAKRLVQYLKIKCPNPVSCDADGSDRAGSYCVGGSIYHTRIVEDWRVSAYDGTSFPTATTLKALFASLNYTVENDLLITIADKIVRLNDKGDFEGAWQAFEEALSYCALEQLTLPEDFERVLNDNIQEQTR